MGSAVHKHAVENGYSVVREIGGHGVGVEFHEDPWVSFVSEENTGVLMVPGMMFTIEPMVNMGSDEIYTDEIDEWTVRTEDGLPSAQWEVTVLVTETGCEVICWSKNLQKVLQYIRLYSIITTVVKKMVLCYRICIKNIHIRIGEKYNERNYQKHRSSSVKS